MSERLLSVNGQTVDPRSFPPLELLPEPPLQRITAKRATRDQSSKPTLWKPLPTEAAPEKDILAEMVELYLLEAGEGRVVPTKAKRNVTLSQFDDRGIELRLYFGSIRPYYQRVSAKKQRILRVELEANISVLASLYPNYPRPQFKADEDLDVVHSYYESFNQYSSAIINAAYYRQVIIVISAVMEGVAITVGLKKLSGFTKAQTEVLPIYESLVLALSRKHGAGIVEGLGVEMKLMFMMMVSLGVYGFINYMLPTGEETERKINTFNNVMTGLNNVSGYFSRGQTGATGTPPPATETATSSPPPKTTMPATGIPAPSTAAPAMDVSGMISQFLPMLQNLGPMLGPMMSMFGGGSPPAPTATPGAPIRRPRPVH